MLYSDVEKKLDMQFTISLKQDHPIIPLLEREIESVPLDSSSSETEAFIDLFIDGRYQKHLEGALSKYEAKKMGDFMVVRIASVEMSSEFELSNEISNIPSSVRGSFYLKGDRVFVEYRFASSDLERMSAIGKKIVRMRNGITISDFGPSRGGIRLLDSIQKRTPLAIVSFEADILKKMGLPSETEYFIEYNNYRLENEGLKSIIYNKVDADTWIPGEPAGEGIRITHLTNPMLADVWKSCTVRRMPRAAILAKPFRGKYRAYIFVPLSMMDEQVAILYESADKFPDVEMKLVAAREYNQDAWEWI